MDDRFGFAYKQRWPLLGTFALGSFCAGESQGHRVKVAVSLTNLVHIPLILTLVYSKVGSQGTYRHAIVGPGFAVLGGQIKLDFLRPRVDLFELSIQVVLQ